MPGINAIHSQPVLSRHTRRLVVVHPESFVATRGVASRLDTMFGGATNTTRDDIVADNASVACCNCICLAWTAIRNAFSGARATQVAPSREWTPSPSTVEYEYSLWQWTSPSALPDGWTGPTLEECEQMDALVPEQAFERFVARLKGSVNLACQPELVAGIDAFCERVKANPPLFATMCTLAFGANSSCMDRPMLAWLDMLRAEENAAIAAGEFDHQPERLIDALRHGQRVAEVDRIAAGIAAQQGRDAIETYLHLRTAVRQLLPGDPGIRAGHYTCTDRSGVTEAHIRFTRERLGQMDAELRAYALESPDWQAMLRRR